MRSTIEYCRAVVRRARQAMTAPTADAPKVKVHRHFRLEKFDGEPPQPGEHKDPVEIIEGGDGEPTVVTNCRTGERRILKEEQCSSSF